MIVVAGGTGRLGTKVVTRLRQRGLAVRVLTRERSRAAHLEEAGVEIVEGDVRDLATVRGAVAGAQTVVSAIQGFAGTKDGPPRSIETATDTLSSLRVSRRSNTLCSFRSKTLRLITRRS
jgi:uncharacterized protein YbjT (DUF2867 family)